MIYIYLFDSERQREHKQLAGGVGEGETDFPLRGSQDPGVMT